MAAISLVRTSAERMCHYNEITLSQEQVIDTRLNDLYQHYVQYTKVSYNNYYISLGKMLSQHTITDRLCSSTR